MNTSTTKKYANTAVICLSPFHGGMEMDAVRIAKLLSDSVGVYLIAKNNSPISEKYKEELSASNIKLETINFSSVYSLSIILRARKILKENNIKNVIYLGASELHALAFSFSGLNINLIVRHGTTKTRSKKDFLHRMAYKNVSYHIAICQHLADNVRRIIPFGKNTELKVIYSSLRHQPVINRRMAEEKDRAIRLLHVGRIIDSKGQADAVDACEILYKNNIRFELVFLGEVGPGYEEYFVKHIKQKPYANHIHVMGFKTELSNYYNDSDILLFPTKGEGLSNTFIEALSYGLACVCYENTSFPELRELGFDFFMAINLDIESLKNTILKAVDFVKDDKVPVTTNIELAKTLFCREHELGEYLKLLN